jgi:hypothetical protein
MPISTQITYANRPLAPAFTTNINLSAFQPLMWKAADAYTTVPKPLPGSPYYYGYGTSYYLNNVVNPGIANVFENQYDSYFTGDLPSTIMAMLTPLPNINSITDLSLNAQLYCTTYFNSASAPVTALASIFPWRAGNLYTAGTPVTFANTDPNSPINNLYIANTLTGSVDFQSPVPFKNTDYWLYCGPFIYSSAVPGALYMDGELITYNGYTNRVTNAAVAGTSLRGSSIFSSMFGTPQTLIPRTPSGSTGPTSTGTVTTYGAYTIHTFTSSGSITVPTGFTGTAYTLLVGGGGGGGGQYVGGGGGGGQVLTTTAPFAAGAYSVTIGAGGAGGNSTGTVHAANGGASTISFATPLTAIGGGGGGSYSGGANNNGNSGASGGGGGGNDTGTVAGGSGTFGFSGGNGNLGPILAGGGGGGAGGAGNNANALGQGGNGGPGLTPAFIGTFFGTYGGGGGGGVNSGTAGTGGSGGGGYGQAGSGIAALAGATNSGGGGGGVGGGTNRAGPSGGSGIVMIAYLTPTAQSFFGQYNMLKPTPVVGTSPPIVMLNTNPGDHGDVFEFDLDTYGFGTYDSTVPRDPIHAYARDSWGCLQSNATSFLTNRVYDEFLIFSSNTAFRDMFRGFSTTSERYINQLTGTTAAYWLYDFVLDPSQPIHPTVCPAWQDAQVMNDGIAQASLKYLPSRTISSSTVSVTSLPFLRNSDPSVYYWRIPSSECSRYSLWDPVQSIVIEGNTVPANSEDLPVSQPILTGAIQPAYGDSRIILAEILTKINPAEDSVTYEPQFPRQIYLSSGTDLKFFAYRISWRNKFTGELVPLLLSNTGSALVVFMFQPK